MKLDILKDELNNLPVFFTEDGGDETANIINPNGRGNIIVTYFSRYPDPFTVLYQTVRRHFTELDDMVSYVKALTGEVISVIELVQEGKSLGSGDIVSGELLNMTVEELADCFGYHPDYLVGKICRIRSWSGSYDADLKIMSGDENE